jgi:hypothetical protein
MPYIKPGERHDYDDWIAQLPIPLVSGEIPAGHLNYVLTCLCLKYLKANGTSYKTYNDMIGVLECAKLEMYRRHVSHYEEEKMEENGDVTGAPHHKVIIRKEGRCLKPRSR